MGEQERAVVERNQAMVRRLEICKLKHNGHVMAYYAVKHYEQYDAKQGAALCQY